METKYEDNMETREREGEIWGANVSKNESYLGEYL